MKKIIKFLTILLLTGIAFSCKEPMALENSLQMKRDTFVVTEENVFDYDIQAEGTRVATFELVNQSEAPLTVTGISIDHAEFSVMNSENQPFETFDLVIEPGQKLDIIVKYTPADKSQDSANVLVSVSGGETGGTADILYPIQASYGVTKVAGKGNTGLDVYGDLRFYDFQQVSVGTAKNKPVRLTNVAGKDIVITSCSFKDGLFDFGYTGIELPQVVAAGATLDFQLNFVPLNEVKQADIFQLFTETGSFDINLRGEGMVSSKPILKLSGPDGTEVTNLVQMANVMKGSNGVPQTFTITNVGGTTLVVQEIQSTKPSIFQIDTANQFANGQTLSLGRNAHYEFTVQFNPVAIINYKALISVANNSEDEFVGFTVEANGLDPAQPEIDVYYEAAAVQSSGSINLGASNINTALIKDLVIHNPGGVALNITSMKVVDKAFVILDETLSPIAMPAKVNPESYVIWKAKFISDSIGPFQSAVELVTNDNDEGVYALTLSALCTDSLPLKKPEFKAGLVNWFAVDSAAPTWEWFTPQGSGGSGIFKIRLNNDAFGNEISDVTYTPDAPLAEGAHTLYVIEKNEYGEWSAEASFTITCDYVVTDPPVISYTPDLEKAGISYAATSTPVMTWEPADIDDATAYQYRIDEGEWFLTSSKAAELPVLADGIHKIEIRTKDNYERWSRAVAMNLTVDTTGPVITINGGTDLLLPKGAIFSEFKRAATAVDSNPLTTTAISVDASAVDNNNGGAIYDVVYSSTDELGNIGTTVLRTHIIDLTGLTLTVEKAAETPLIEGGSDLTFKVAGLPASLLSQVDFLWTTSAKNSGLGVLGFSDQAPAVAGENLVRAVSYDNPATPSVAEMDLLLKTTVTKVDTSTATYTSAGTFNIFPDSKTIIKNRGFEDYSGSFVEFDRSDNTEARIYLPDYLATTDNTADKNCTTQAEYDAETPILNAWPHWGFSYMANWGGSAKAITPVTGAFYTDQYKDFGQGDPNITSLYYANDGGANRYQWPGEVLNTLGRNAFARNYDAAKPSENRYCAIVGDLDQAQPSSAHNDITDITGFIFQEISLIPGMTYELSVWVYNTANTAPSVTDANPDRETDRWDKDCVRIGVFNNNDIKDALKVSPPAQQLASGAGWQQIKLQFVATQTLTRLAVEVAYTSQGDNGGAGHQGYRFDDFAVTYIP